MNFKKPIIITAVSALAVSGALLTQPTYAAQATKTIKAVYNNISIVYNGNTVATDASTEPFMINGTTYLPLRMVGTALDKKVSWDGTNKRVVIEDNGTVVDQSTITALNNQINTLSQELNAAKASVTSKDATIADLQAQIADLKEEAEDSSTDIDDLEDNLNDDFGDYEDTESEIVLTGDEDDITLRVNVDDAGWDDLSSSAQLNLIQDIVDDIKDAYEDADISGTVRDNSNSDTLATISVRSSGTATLSDETVDLDDLEDQLNDDYDSYEGVSFSIDLSGDEDDVTVKIYVDQAEWEELTSSEQNDYLDDIVNDIEDELSDADISGYVYDEDDNDRLDTF